MMGKWAKRYGSQVQFLMVCVDSAGVAIRFGKMFDLSGVVNTIIPSRGYMPVGYGQLGCSGFIVSDRNGYFVSRKTKAYLRYGTAAFLDVEEILKKKFGIYPTDRSRSDEVKSQGEQQDVLHPNWTLPSVGIPSMDQEHEKCEEALSALLLTLDVESLTNVMAILTEHFQHEEGLMRASEFGNPGESLSAFSNHVNDHERILDIGYSALAKFSNKIEPNKSFLAMKCSEVQGEVTETKKPFLAAACMKAKDSDRGS
eukprot:CCRYP_015350-RA/>CCRYP_015350-RA protein AED:0.06 eAED:0.06 QI:281/1/1/1/1/0.66/3/559/255